MRICWHRPTFPGGLTVGELAKWSASASASVEGGCGVGGGAGILVRAGGGGVVVGSLWWTGGCSTGFCFYRQPVFSKSVRPVA